MGDFLSAGRGAAAAEAADITPPKHFLCPISQDVMKDPVLTTAFQTYERESIEKWFALGRRTDPMTGQRLGSTALRPNGPLRDAIQEWQRCFPEMQQEATSYNNLAESLVDQGRYDEAKPLHEKALAIRLKIHGEMHPMVALSYNNVAVLLKKQGK